MELKDLERRANRIKERAGLRYHLARSLGFSARESMVLQNQSEENIKRLASERSSKLG